MAPGYVIYAFKEGSIRVINQSAKDTVLAERAPLKAAESAPESALGHLALKPWEDHFKLSNASKAHWTFS